MQEKKLGLGSVVATGVGLVVATTCLVSLGQGAGSIGTSFVIAMVACGYFNSNNGNVHCGVKCADAESIRWSGAVYAGMYGTVSYDCIHDRRLSRVQYLSCKRGVSAL